MGSNVTDDTRLEFLERGRQALVILEQKKQELASAHKIFSTVLKDAKRAGATEIRWTLKALRRDPADLQAEITERNRMMVIAKIPVGQQLGMFEGLGETLSEVVARVAQRAAQQDAAGIVITPGQEAMLERSFAETNEVAAEPQAFATVELPPRQPAPDDEEDEPDEEPPEDEGEEEASTNVSLEGSEAAQNAYLMGTRAYPLGRTLEGNPFRDEPMYNAWIRGWKASEAAAKNTAR